MAKIVCNRPRRPLAKPDNVKAPVKQAPAQDLAPSNAGPR